MRNILQLIDLDQKHRCFNQCFWSKSLLDCMNFTRKNSIIYLENHKSRHFFGTIDVCNSSRYGPKGPERSQRFSFFVTAFGGVTGDWGLGFLPGNLASVTLLCHSYFSKDVHGSDGPGDGPKGPEYDPFQLLYLLLYLVVPILILNFFFTLDFGPKRVYIVI